MPNAVYQSVVARLALQAPLLAKGLVNASLERHKLSAETVSPFQMKQLLDRELLPKLRRVLGDVDRTASRLFATLELTPTGFIRHADPMLRLFLRGLDLRDPGRLRAELIERGVLPRAAPDGAAPAQGSEEAGISYLKEPGAELKVSRFPLGLDGSGGTLVLIEDVTIERALEAEMEQMVRRLEDAHDALRRSQAEMVKTETLASLGGLVAGVAHEINTPVGIGVTAATHLASQVAALRAELAEGKLKKSSLDRFLEEAEESTALVLSNLGRAADLVRSFKQVSVDQTQQDVREFELGGYLKDILASLRPQLKKTPVVVETDFPYPVQVEACAGALAQIVTNLVQNALLHAFPNGRKGTIKLRTEATGEWAQVLFDDDGLGMPPDVREKAFVPFFTTKRNQGGSGLGLSIVHNLVTKTLGGEIDLESAPAQGSWFTIRFPLRPAQVARSQA